MDIKELANKRIMIIGAGLSGCAAANLLAGTCPNLVLYDANSSGAMTVDTVRSKLSADFKGRIELGDMPEDLRSNLDMLILSPGVPRDLPFVTLMEHKGTQVIGEIELAYYFSKGRIVGVTGTNGKTTTTALTGHILDSYFGHTIVVGNIGTPYTDLVRQTDEDTYTVAELSSFQLDTTQVFHPDVSMVLNITPDHLDRHHTMRNYIDAKFKIAANQTAEDICILNYEDATLREMAQQQSARIVWFSSSHRLKDGFFYADGRIYRAEDGVETEICDTSQMKLIGTHNYENAMAAIAAAMHFNVPVEAVREAVYSFNPVPHRIEYVATKNGVKYYNDSKGTNPDASIKAVKAMTSQTYLIGGGYDKNSEYDEWIDSFDGKIKHLVLMGQTKGKIAECAIRHGFNNITFVESMKEAVEFCSARALPGETVLLSPCCASWGMFKNYEERGDIFKELVNSL